MAEWPIDVSLCVEQLLLDGDVDSYNFIKHSSKRIEGVDDAEEYQNLSVSSSGEIAMQSS